MFGPPCGVLPFCRERVHQAEDSPAKPGDDPSRTAAQSRPVTHSADAAWPARQETTLHELAADLARIEQPLRGYPTETASQADGRPAGSSNGKPRPVI
jgi:hypothetical protein